jgi:hypothetical protein
MVLAGAAALLCAAPLAAAAAPAGTWHTAIEVPGTATLNQGNEAGVSSLSCPSAGNCAAVGDYSTSKDLPRAFVVSQHNGTWSTAIEMPGTESLPNGPLVTAGVNTLSCASAGNCAADGNYEGGSGGTKAWVASQTNGTWSNAIELPGLGGANLESVSCGSAGNCAAGGGYYDGSDGYQAFLASES